MLVLACSLVTILAGVYVLSPLFSEPKGNLEVELLAETKLDRLLNRKAIIYSNLKELEFEYKMGRLSDADFRRLESGYKSEAGLIFQELDQLGAEKDLDENIEKEVAARKARLYPGASSPEKEQSRCPACGTATVPGKKFCADCGQKL
jgi:hypothetical protein